MTSPRPPRLLGWTLLAALACDAAPAAPPPAAAPPPPAPAPTVTATADADRRPVVIGERFRLRSQVLGEDRELFLYTPTLAPGATYPVLYLLDGDSHFHHVTGLVEFLAGQGRMPPVIVVGVANTDRTRDLTPTRLDPHPTSGGADTFLRFLETELVPHIEGRYPTAPYRVLIGHSFGGLLAVHALNQRPDLFDALISISPSLWWHDRMMERDTTALLRARPDLDRALYLSVGDEPGRMLEGNRAYAAMLTGAAPKALRWRFEEMPREDHGSIVHRSVYHGLELVFDGWQPPPDGADTLAELEAHWTGAARRFRVPPRIPEDALNLFGYKLLGDGRLDEALAVFRRNVELNPDSANVHDSLGEALEKKGDLAGAAASYAAAVDVAARKDDRALALFRANLARAQELAARKPG